MEPYSPREIRFWGLREPGRWALKLYSVLYGPGPVDWEGFEPALQMAERQLPKVDESRGRPGLGFLIAHQGRTGDYVVLAWWDHENELPLRVWVRRGRDKPWCPAKDGESVCVFDLEILWAERRAWVETMLTKAEPNHAGYLAQVETQYGR